MRFCRLCKLLMNEWIKINVFKHQSKMLIVMLLSLFSHYIVASPTSTIKTWQWCKIFFLFQYELKPQNFSLYKESWTAKVTNWSSSFFIAVWAAKKIISFWMPFVMSMSCFGMLTASQTGTSSSLGLLVHQDSCIN